MVDGILLFSQVPVTMAAIRAIKEAGNQRPHGSCLAKFHSTLHDPAGLGGFDIASHEEERDRRGRARLEGGDDFWSRFQRQVLFQNQPIKSTLLYKAFLFNRFTSDKTDSQLNKMVISFHI